MQISISHSIAAPGGFIGDEELPPDPTSDGLLLALQFAAPFTMLPTPDIEAAAEQLAILIDAYDWGT